MSHSNCTTCPILAARNEELAARIADLEREVFNREWQAPREMRLTPAGELKVDGCVAMFCQTQTWRRAG